MKKLIFLLVLLCGACSTHHGNFTVVSNKIVNVKDFDLTNSPKQKNVMGEDRKHIILWFSTGTPTVAAALNDVSRKTDTDLLTNASIEYSEWYIPLIYGQKAWIVRGDAVKTRDN